MGPLTHADEATVEFNRDIRPILSDNCYHCHGPAEKSREADLRLDLQEHALADRDGYPAIVAGRPQESLLWERISSNDPDVMMPPPDSNKTLTDDQKLLLKKWIEQGAKWQGHWAFLPPTKPPVPSVSQPGWVHNPIDAFVLARLDREGLKPSPEAAREMLIRRVTFDLTGLPPTLQEIDEFVNDTDDNAYEKVVDRLLASKRYGERMTLAWMDAARYGDTSVFHADGPRDMWPWRDWVIRAYNNNMPFDQFTREQLAGDLIPDATVDQKIASGFNRNHGTTDEGGAIAEEYRVEYVVDRVKTTSTVWMGLTMECGQCHDHKYDPISQKEYYQFYAYFNQSADGGMQTRNGNAAPMIDVPNPAGEQKIETLETKLAAVQGQIDDHVAKVQPAFDAWQKEQSAKADSESQLPAGMLAYFPLDEGKGSEVVDSLDSSRKASITGNALWEAGQFASCLKLDGNTYVDLGDVADFERTDAFSYGAWLYLDNHSGGGAPLARMNDGNAYRGYDLWVQAGSPGVHIINQWPSNAIKVVTKKKLETKKWQHVFVTYDGSSKASGVKIYIDGQEEPWNIEQDRLSETIRSKVPLRLGRRNPGGPFKGRVDDVRIYPRALTAAEVAALAGNDPIKPILATAEQDRTPEQVATLRQHYLTNHDAAYQRLRDESAKLKAEIAEVSKPISTVMIMQDLPNPRMTYVLERGHYASPNKEQPIQPGVPAALLPLPNEAPSNRLGLAQWLTQPDHPLTARVAVNRYWSMLFGAGIVKTVADFGSQGDWPSHPELLDWLAVDFAENGWNIKRTLKQIVMSSTYRQSSRVSPELYQRDSENRLLARGPRFRLQAEFIRDQALAISGLLVEKIGGPGVKPYQPPGLWNEVSLSGNVRFVQDHGDKLYRRGMYTYWKRSAPAPNPTIFDAPTREKCVVQRARTNTPLQALAMLNDTQFVEASRVLAQRMMKEGGSTPEERVDFAYRLATARRPTAIVRKILVDGYHEEVEAFRNDEQRAQKLVATGEFPRDEKLDVAEHAAWTVVASMILNMDQCLTRG